MGVRGYISKQILKARELINSGVSPLEAYNRTLEHNNRELGSIGDNKVIGLGHNGSMKGRKLMKRKKKVFNLRKK